LFNWSHHLSPDPERRRECARALDHDHNRAPDPDRDPNNSDLDRAPDRNPEHDPDHTPDNDHDRYLCLDDLITYLPTLTSIPIPT
jgi:hypothetical protein